MEVSANVRRTEPTPRREQDGETYSAATRSRSTSTQPVAVHFYPADRGLFHGHPHVMFPHCPRHAICCSSRGPSFGLFPRHRRYRQRENGTTPYTCERFLVSGFGAPNLHQVATTWPKAAVGGARSASARPRSYADCSYADRRMREVLTGRGNSRTANQSAG